MELYTFTTTKSPYQNPEKYKTNYYFTNNKEDYNSLEHTYKSIFIEKTEISLEIAKDGIKINTVLKEQPFFSINNFILNKSLEVEVAKVVKDNNGNDKIIKIFNGYVINYEIDVYKQMITLHRNNMTNLFNRKCPTRTFSTRCSFKLYGKECKADRYNFYQSLNVNDITLSSDKKTLTINNINLNVNDYTSGILDLNDDEQQIFIQSNTSNTITLLFPILAPTIHQVKIFKGCNKTLDNCKNKFNNIRNYGGFPFIPRKNPVVGL